MAVGWLGLICLVLGGLRSDLGLVFGLVRISAFLDPGLDLGLPWAALGLIGVCVRFNWDCHGIASGLTWVEFVLILG